MAIFEIAKNGIWSKKNFFVKLIYLISRLLLAWTFLNFLAHCGILQKKKNFVKSKYHFIGGGRNIMNIMHASTFNVTKKESSPIPLSASGLNFPTKTEPEAYKPPQQSIDRAMEMKREILSKVERLGKILPPNTLDQLIGKIHALKKI